ncbi:hypothetical protein B9Z55_019035 [Caenorhabditis nigoni]|uniref:Uncharacterized protein n=1 Tax=Caenorhabditis nigoni TaxID=1611254 RepID=A0A2G5TGN6_9PELO|nr:hypothetical protein B9Z55_019035 [Caenorhabditis nigoni]
MSSEEASSMSDSERSKTKSFWTDIKPSTISGRQCLVVRTKLKNPQYANLMLHCENHPEIVNNRPPTKPGYHKLEIYVVQKRVKFDRLIQDKLQWLLKGNHRTSHYILKGDCFQFTKNKSEATHILRQSDYTFSAWSGLDKTILRMLLKDEKHEHCFNSLIVYQCKSNFQRPVVNIRDVEVNHVGERSFDSEAENERQSAGSTEDMREEEADEQ